jgi:RimJ/RimL family protein N-acetyltransferase
MFRYAANPVPARSCQTLGHTNPKMQHTIRQIQLRDAEDFRTCLDSVARERKYLAQVEAPPLEKVREFVAQSVEQDSAQYVVVANERIVGWCDVFAHWAYALKHVGTLGMGIEAGFRGQGLGRALLLKTLEHALKNEIYRVTLEAREDNERAIRLYEQVGFKHEARAACALRFEGRFYTGITMALLQGPASVA